jgi:predicted O-methyltransferase YrrM
MSSCDLDPRLKNSINYLYPSPPEEVMKCVEIGSFEGRGSISINNHLCKHKESILYCIDPFDDEYVKGSEKMAFWNYACEGQYARFKTNTANLPKIVEMRGVSDLMIPLLDNDSVDFCYIDGDHSPEQVYKDITNVFEKMKNKSIVLFDDYLWEMNGIVTKTGIDKFLEEYRGRYELLFQNFQLAIRIIK